MTVGAGATLVGEAVGVVEPGRTPLPVATVLVGAGPVLGVVLGVVLVDAAPGRTPPPVDGALAADDGLADGVLDATGEEVGPPPPEPAPPEPTPPEPTDGAAEPDDPACATGRSTCGSAAEGSVAVGSTAAGSAGSGTAPPRGAEYGLSEANGESAAVGFRSNQAMRALAEIGRPVESRAAPGPDALPETTQAAQPSWQGLAGKRCS